MQFVVWVPGHTRVDDKKRTNGLVHVGSQNHFCEFEPDIDSTIPDYLTTLIQGLLKFISIYWISSPGTRDFASKHESINLYYGFT